ncbi:MAG: hypothetical protein JJT96_07660 [Opitutales bacterium]|nr:hypothetical protein [Opitutales bacterium]
MKRLIVFLDSESAKARALRRLLARREWRVDIEILPMQGRTVRMCYPELGHVSEDADIVSLSDTGLVEEGRAAWRTVIWAFKGGVPWSDFLGRIGADEAFDELVNDLLSGRLDINEEPRAALARADFTPRAMAVGA